MPSPFALELTDGLTSVTAAGEGEAIEVPLVGTGDLAYRRNAVIVDIEIESLTVGGVLVVNLEASADGSSWRTVATAALSGKGKHELASLKLDAQLRLSWALQAGATAATFSASGEALVVYSDPGDLKRYGLPEAALEDLTTRERLDACMAACDEADGYLGASYTLPMLKWGRDLRLHTSKMAVRYVLDRRGWDPEGRDNVIETAFDRAISWLKRISNGQLDPPEMVDSTPETFEAGSVVVSRPRRESSWL